MEVGGSRGPSSRGSTKERRKFSSRRPSSAEEQVTKNKKGGDKRATVFAGHDGEEVFVE